MDSVFLGLNWISLNIYIFFVISIECCNYDIVYLKGKKFYINIKMVGGKGLFLVLSIFLL